MRASPRRALAYRAFLLAPALLAVTAGRASADVCELMDRTTAERVAAILRAAGTLVHDDWFNPVAVQTVEVRADGNLYVVVVNDTFVPDAAYVYVPGDAGTYRAIGPEVGCEGVDVAGEPWLRLDVIWPGPCEGEETAAIGSGWVPAYATSGAANVWYYSRGC